MLSITRVAVQVLSEPINYHRLQILLGVPAQCRGTKLIEARKLSRCIEALLRADARIRVQETLQNCLGSRSKSKKCDKPINYIVRVIVRLFVFSVLEQDVC
jgi:hypothetical protein